MKRICVFVVFIFLIVSFTSSLLFAVTHSISVSTKHGQKIYLYKDSYALVIGVSEYEKWPRLTYATNDAKKVASILKALGYVVTLVLDPNYREMKSALSKLVYESGREVDRAILLFYAGHGETETLADGTKMGYLIPKDCPVLEKNPMEFFNHAISMKDIESASMRIRSKHVLMVFDSCFSGALFNLVRAVPADITEKIALPVRQFITAGREDEVVPDRSMFIRCLIVGLEGDADLTGDGYITGSELGMYLSDKVINYTHRQQHPQYGKINNPNLDRGDFVFAGMKDHLKQQEERKRQMQKIESQLSKFKERRKEAESVLLKYDAEIKAYDTETKALETELQKLKSEAAIGLKNTDATLSKPAKNGKLISTQAPTQNIKLDTRPSLAILPWKFRHRGFDYIQTAVDALIKVNKEIQLFTPKYSYYDLGRKPKSIKINQDIMAGIAIDDLWIKKNWFSLPEPNIALIDMLGKHLQVDAVLMYYLDANERRFMNMSVYLVKLESKKTYFAKAWEEDGIAILYGSSEIKKITKKVFLKYKDSYLQQ